jgi:hypothetical protein
MATVYGVHRVAWEEDFHQYADLKKQKVRLDGLDIQYKKNAFDIRNRIARFKRDRCLQTLII